MIQSNIQLGVGNVLVREFRCFKDTSPTPLTVSPSLAFGVTQSVFNLYVGISPRAHSTHRLLQVSKIPVCALFGGDLFQISWGLSVGYMLPGDEEPLNKWPNTLPYKKLIPCCNSGFFQGDSVNFPRKLKLKGNFLPLENSSFRRIARWSVPFESLRGHLPPNYILWSALWSSPWTNRWAFNCN